MFPPDRGPVTCAAAVLLAVLAHPGPLAAAEGGIKSKLDAVERDLDRNRAEREKFGEAAGRAEAELREIKLRGVALARELHRRDEEISLLEDQIAILEHDEHAKAERLVRRRIELAATLGALQRIARLPATTLIALPRPPDDTIRSAILLRAAVPELQRQAGTLSKEIESLAELRQRIADDRKSLGTAVASLDEERTRLAASTARKLALLDSMRDAERKAAEDTARLSAKAANMRELLDRLGRQRKDAALRGPDFEPPPEDPAKDKNGAAAPATGLPKSPRVALLAPRIVGPAGILPAPGRIVVGFGEVMPNGVTSKGISIATRPSAAVVAPHPGRVVFAGNFRGYGNLVILELRNKGHALISGLSKISASVGDEVLAGEPLGEMTPSTDAAPRLYFELRRRGQPVNPLPPAAANRNKVSG